MAKHFLNTHRETTWKVNGNNGVWTVSDNAEIDILMDFVDETFVAGLFEDEQFHGNDLVVNGDITALGSASAVGIFSLGKGTDILIGKTGEIDANMGIFSKGQNASIENRGDISATSNGIYAELAKSIINSGEINAFYAVTAGADGAEVVNRAGGLISGTYAIQTTGQTSTIRNNGSVMSPSNSIADGCGDVHVINKGWLFGGVNLGGGDDIFDTRGGGVIGVVLGGTGDDLFRVSSSKVLIHEGEDEGADRIMTSANLNMKTMGEVELVRAVGTQNINLIGNAYENTLVGNTGANRLAGMEGADYLQGAQGDDRLTGGGDSDVFIFTRGCDADMILDFIQGQDLIELDGYAGIAFGDLAARTADVAAGTKITLLDGDSILLEGVHGVTLTIDDFLI